MEDNTAERKKVKKLSPIGSKNADLSTVVFGKIPPQAKELEEAVLGALMIDKNALGEVMDVLKTETFYAEANSIIFQAILDLFEKSKPIDILTVSEQLKQNGDLEAAGGISYLTDLTNRVASAAHSEYHARIIVQKFVQRELIRVSTETIKESYEDTTDVFDLLDKAEQNIFEITDKNLRGGTQEMGQLVGKAIKEIDSVRENDGKLLGIPSGFTDLDYLTAGWQPTDLVIVAGRPAMGKTAFVLSMARNAAVDHGIGIGIFSLEMGALQLTKRLIASECEIESEKIKKGELKDYEWEELNAKSERLAQAPIYIVDTPAINVFELRAQCRRLVSNKNVKMILIDYLQLMSGTNTKGGGNREQEISNISRSLKGLAKELNIPVIALSQLSRAVETRGGNKRPMLSDLRESGAIEQDADMVLFLYRPEYYDFHEDEEGNSTKGMGEVIIAKHRNGPTGSVKLKFIAKFAKFDNANAFSDMEFGDTAFQNSNIVSIGSKMNEGDDDFESDLF